MADKMADMMIDNTTAERRWTPAQKSAIDFAGDNLMLLAAAGSGKTAVLTERVAALVADGADISRMLIVTYTNAAADELRSRIRSALESRLAAHPGDKRIASQLISLEHAEICTILSFFMSALRPHFAALGLPPDFGVSETATADAIRRRVMAEVTDSLFTEGDEHIIRLADCLGGARDENKIDDQLCAVMEGLTGLGHDAASLYRFADEMESAAEKDFYATMYGEESRRQSLAFFAHYEKLFDSLYGDMEADASHPKPFEKYGAAARDCAHLCRRMIGLIEDEGYSAAREAIKGYAPVSLSSLPAKDQTEESLIFKEERTGFLKKIKTIASSLFGTPPEEIARLLHRSGELCRDCGVVAERFFTRYTEEKQRRGKVDFSDLESYAKKLFVGENGKPTAAAAELEMKYDYIFIDEYQDSNAVQDAVFAAIAGERGRFLVGDMKQSIYGFRGAVPEIFGGYREKWGGGDGGNVIFMSDNFRCDAPVIDFTNLVSSELFPFSATPFEEGDMLRAGKDGAEEGECVEVCIIEKQTGTPAEAEYVASRIDEMLQNGRRRDGVPYSPDDFAILLRSSTARSDYENALARRGIPVKMKRREPFFENPSVRLALCLMHAADNPSSDIYLAGAMKSPVFGFTVEDLSAVRDYTPEGTLWYAVRRYCDPAGGSGGDTPDLSRHHTPKLEHSKTLAGRLADFAAELSRLRDEARGGSAVRFVGYIYDRYGLTHLCRDSFRAADQKALTRLFDEARAKSTSEFCSLYGFLAYLDDLIAKGEDGGEEDSGSGVSVISIHHSKGLEYPVCFVSDTGRGFNRSGSTDNLLLDAALGMAARIPDDSGLIRFDTPVRQAISARRRRKETEEEMRVLYVALTRAREKLIVTGTVKDPENMIARASAVHSYRSEYSVMNASSMLSWIADSIRSPGAAQVKYRLNLISADGVESGDEENCVSDFPADAGDSSDGATPLTAEEYAEVFSARFRFRYPYEIYCSMPSKLTVSKLYPGLLDEDEVRMTIDRVDPPKEEADDAPLPRFMADVTSTGAERGIATHVFMQFCDFAALAASGAESEILRLRESGFITAAMAELIDRTDVEKFRCSDLLRRMLSARRMWREFRFNASMPAADFTLDGSLCARLEADGATVTVQGVVDCMFEDADGKIVLADYKTDRLTDYELDHSTVAAQKLLDRHKNQISYYRKICSAMLGRSVDEAYIYSLPLGDTIEVPL